MCLINFHFRPSIETAKVNPFATVVAKLPSLAYSPAFTYQGNTEKTEKDIHPSSTHKRGCHFVASCEPCSTIAAIWSTGPPLTASSADPLPFGRVTTNRAIMNRFRLPSTTTRGSSVWQCCLLAIVLFSFPKAWHPPRAECLNWNLMTRDLLSHIDSRWLPNEKQKKTVSRAICAKFSARERSIIKDLLK